jgi:signal transduction histidine kinase/HAMP domain-containing protein
MPDLIILLKNLPTLHLPGGWLGWGEWLAFLVIVAFAQRNLRDFNQPLERWRLRALFLFIVLVPLTTILIPSIMLGPASDPSMPDSPANSSGTPLTPFAAMPWFLAAGFLGPAGAAGLAAFSGILIALWGTHNSFLPLELAGMATFLSWAINQSYRTAFFRLLRRPLIVSLLIAAVSPALLFIDALLTAQGDLAVRIDYGLTHIGAEIIAFSISLVIAGLIAEGFARIAPTRWGAQATTEPSPAESKLTGRFLYIVFPMALILLLVLIVGDWIVAGRVAEQMLLGRMKGAAEMTAGIIPSFSNTGVKILRNLVQEPRYHEMTPNEVREALSHDIINVPYFSQLIYLNPQGEVVACQPSDSVTKLPLSQNELFAVASADDIPIQDFPIRPEPGGKTALISYVAGVYDDDRNLSGILIGRSDLSQNPFATSLIVGLASLSDIPGYGILIDGDANILYHPDPTQIMTTYTGRQDIVGQLFSEPSIQGSVQRVYHLPVKGSSWSVIFKVPAQYVQERAVYIAVPLIGIIFVLTLIAVILVQFSLKTVTASLQWLAGEANLMARGDLDQPLKVEREDEIGQLGRAFEQMRASLKSRLDELNRLLHVSQGVASTLDVEASLAPVLESALVSGATASRVVLVPTLLPHLNGSQSARIKFGYGPAADSFAYLDEQILALTQRQDVVKLTNLTHPRLFSVPSTSPRPQSILAVAIRHENLYYGALWNAYERPHQFSEAEVRYLSTLAGQAALAAANARLFLTAEIGRLRMEAILTSTPDPVLVIDQSDHLLLTNPAARQILDLAIGSSLGKAVDDVIMQEDLVTLLKSKVNDQQSAEISFPDGKVYLATASTMYSDETRVGRVCVLRDVTSFKRLDEMKSEFVSTVSHDLRAPLTMIQGYASMVPIVGDLNEQQSNYLRKISLETEKISRLVHNVLNLGRMESNLGLQLERKQVREVLERVVNSLQARAAQKRIQLVLESIRADLPEIEADQDLLQQALFNLVENAIKFTNSDGKVTLDAQVSPDQITLTVQDTGIGISPTDQTRLFEKYYSPARKGSKIEGGTGLGLAIVKSIVERHGGRVWVESQLGKGSKFFLAIPIRQANG